MTLKLSAGAPVFGDCESTSNRYFQRGFAPSWTDPWIASTAFRPIFLEYVFRSTGLSTLLNLWNGHSTPVKQSLALGPQTAWAVCPRSQFTQSQNPLHRFRRRATSTSPAFWPIWSWCPDDQLDQLGIRSPSSSFWGSHHRFTIVLVWVRCETNPPKKGTILWLFFWGPSKGQHDILFGWKFGGNNPINIWKKHLTITMYWERYHPTGLIVFRGVGIIRYTTSIHQPALWNNQTTWQSPSLFAAHPGFAVLHVVRLPHRRLQGGRAQA